MENKIEINMLSKRYVFPSHVPITVWENAIHHRTETTAIPHTKKTYCGDERNTAFVASMPDANVVAVPG